MAPNDESKQFESLETFLLHTFSQHSSENMDPNSQIFTKEVLSNLKSKIPFKSLLKAVISSIDFPKLKSRLIALLEEN